MDMRKIKRTAFTFICILLLICKGHAQNTFDEKHLEVSLRMIGHQVLLNSQDSTSRVLPVIKNKNQYRIEFESEFAFEPDELVTTINRVIKKTGLANRYIVEVEHCENGQIVYSYEMDELVKSNLIPCKTRALPKSCYRLLFTLPEMSGTKAAMSPADTNLADGAHPKTSPLKYITFVFLSALLSVLFYFLWKKRNRSTVNPNLIPLGDYCFDQRNSALIIKQEKISLSSKEADLLHLLYQAADTTVEREVILNKVWGDEGDYVGRTLDVFISKLRKKLTADPKVKIVNIRGIGYKLVLDV